MEALLLASLVLLIPCLVMSVRGYGGIGFDPLERFMKAKRSEETSKWDAHETYSPLYVSPQGGLMEVDKIDKLPGQPERVDFDQYSGYVTVDPNAGRALFYYFTESPETSTTKPLVLWLSGGPGCSSFGNGAMMELGPFRVSHDGRSLSRNGYAWNIARMKMGNLGCTILNTANYNKPLTSLIRYCDWFCFTAANVIFLESPAGVGFSYSNTTSDYELSGEMRTADDSYTFLVNWLERFPQYKTRDFFIAGESYAGHYVPQLAYIILQKNKVTNQTAINLKGIAMGNAVVDNEATNRGEYNYLWTHALISDEIHHGISSNCNFSQGLISSDSCGSYVGKLSQAIGRIFIYDIYAPLCKSSPPDAPSFGWPDPRIDSYIYSYLNTAEVQKALHANVTAIPYPWSSCSNHINWKWKDSPSTILPIIQQLMNIIQVWIYSGDTDGRVPVTSSKYSIDKLNTFVKTAWIPWYNVDEVGGYAVEYQNLAFVTVRGAGHFVPSYQPARALSLFSSFLRGKFPHTS